MFDLISIGSISVDLYFKGDSFTFSNNRFQLAIGGKYVADHFYTGIGGGGANVAIGASCLGLRTAVMGKIGNNPFKKIILEYLKEKKVNYSLCDFEDKYYNISSILLSPTGERSIIHFVTPHQHLISEKNPLQNITKTKMVYLGNLPDVSLHERINLLRFLKKHKITTILNLGVKDCRRPKYQLEKFLQLADILILNGHEFSELIKAPYKDIHFKENVIAWYIPQLSQKIVIITEGEKGSYGYWQNHVFYQTALKPRQIIDTTGAGDAYTAGFIVEYLRIGNIIKAMKKGALYASHILGKIGAN